MAEAAVENMSSRFFCHQCAQETNRLLEDYTCPRCRGGFVEELGQDEDEDSMIEENYGNLAQLLGQMVEQQPNNVSGSNQETDQASIRPSTGTGQRRGRLIRVRTMNNQQQYEPFENFLHQVLTNVVGAGVAQAGPTGSRSVINIDMPFPLFNFLHGSPGDYAWGSGGLDAVITQLLNQLESSGPPPMPKEEIEKVPTVKITKEQVDKNLQCSVCMEDFKVGEQVKQIACSHCYHDECIIPWLKLHGTCPICRKELTEYRGNNPNPNPESNSQQQNTSNTASQTSNRTYEFQEEYD